MSNIYFDKLFEKINKKQAKLGVVGLGYVGLPLAVEKSKVGFNVLGFDISEQKINMLNKCENYIGDVKTKDLENIVNSGKFIATTDFSLISECDCVAICVPTPLDKYYQPDISYVESASELIAKYVKKGTLIVLESTTYPGTTEEVIMPMFTEKNLVVGQDIFIAFSPERVDPGNKHFNTKNTPKVVGGVTKNCTKLSALLYKSVLEGEIFEVSSPKVAEMEKILENTFRNINIALANEMAIMCHKMNIPVWEVIDAAKTKPYGFMAFYPGPGLGGHCIPIDPLYLTWKAKGYDYHTKLIQTAGEINDSMPDYVIDRVSKMLNNFKKPINGSKILILGVAYKPDIDDLRESPALKIIQILKDMGAELIINEPYSDGFKHNGVSYETVELNEKILKSADLSLILTNHSCYDPKFIVKNSNCVFDTRNLTKGIDAHNLERL